MSKKRKRNSDELFGNNPEFRLEGNEKQCEELGGCVLDFGEWAKSKPEETKAKEKIRQKLIVLVKNSIHLPFSVRIFGSCYRNLDIPGSDLDVAIVIADLLHPGELLEGVLESVYTELAQDYDSDKSLVFDRLQFISSARVPVIKFKSRVAFDKRRFVFDVDLIAKNSAEFERDSKFESELLSMVPFSFVRPPFLVLKRYLKTVELNEVYSGGLGSHMLLLLCITYYLHFFPKVQASNAQKTGFFLHRFVQFISHFKFRDFELSTEQGKIPRWLPLDNDELSISGPTTIGPIGESCYKFDLVKKAFLNAEKIFQTPRRLTFDDGSEEDILDELFETNPFL